MTHSIFKRFLKGFVAGGLAEVVVKLTAGVSISSLADLKNLGATLLLAFFVGGLLAIQKWLSWTPEPRA